MIQRVAAGTSQDDQAKDVDRRARFINDATAKKMAKVLRPDQMDELRYLLNLIADDFKLQNGISG
jgi:glucose-6-phosphate-specific signal transduction histidine kinase